MSTILDQRLTIESPWLAADENGPLQVVETAGGFAPARPNTAQETGVDVQVLRDIALRMAFTAPNFTTDWAAGRLGLSLQVTADLLEELRHDRCVEVLGQTGPFSLKYAISGPGRERAARLMEISGHVGRAPVSLQAYSAFLDWQLERLPEVTREQVQQSIAGLVLPQEAVEISGLAAAAGRSLFLYGPPGCGKSSIGHLLQNALGGHLWIPYCISVDNTVVRLFDDQSHQRVSDVVTPEEAAQVDGRWVCIKRPFVVVGGELRIEDLDLAYSPALKCYEAPLHLKANGGIFLLDDLGCQRTPPVELLKRWIVPLEHHVDYLTLKTGQKLLVPFRQMLIVSTNLEPDKVMDPAILRRMGYRLLMDYPAEESYTTIFNQYAGRLDIKPDPGLIEHLLQRYRAEKRPLRACDPRDLIERAVDIARYRNQPVQLNEELLDFAWTGYFGHSDGSGNWLDKSPRS